MAKRAYLSIGFLGLLVTGTGRAQPSPGGSLTPEQVACQERQMQRVMHRLSTPYSGSNLFLWRGSSAGGDYRGVATTSHLYFDPSTVVDIRLRDEKQLAFDLTLRDDEDFLNPRRTRLPQATLVRREAASNFDVPSDLRGALKVRMALDPETLDPTSPDKEIDISTLRQQGEGHADGASRGLDIDDLFDSCGVEVTDFDRKVFSILARTVRPSACLVEPMDSFGCDADQFKTAIYRGEEPMTYRFDIYTYFVVCDDDGICRYSEGRTPLLFRLTTDSQARLTGGTVDPLPFCAIGGQTGCIEDPFPEIAVYVLPPLRAGFEMQGEETFQRAARLNIDGEGSMYNVLHADVNWADLLRDSSWNGGLQP